MDLLCTDEQQAIVDAVASVVATRFPIPSAPGPDGGAAPSAAQWRECAALGWLGLGLGEEHGGVGLGLVEEMLLVRELGRGCVAGPFLPTILGARVAALGKAADLARAILAGDSRVALAEPVGSGRWLGFDAQGADALLVVEPEGARLVAPEALRSRRPVESIDPGVTLVEGTLDGGPVVGRLDASSDPTPSRALVLVAAYLTGIVEATRDLSAGYARDRVQFGRPIGANQAVKHRCANMAVRAEVVFAQCCYAALSVDDSTTDAAFQAAAARLVAGDAALASVRDNVQNHGAIGFTWEHPAHRYAKRAHVLDAMLGGRFAAESSVLARQPA